MKKIVHSEQAPKAIGPYSQAITVSPLIFTSGQLPLDPVTMEIVAGGIKEQSRQSLVNLKNVLEAGGASLETVAKTTCYLADINDFSAFNEIYQEFFGTDGAPARSCFEVACLPKNALIEIEAVAYIK